MKIKKILAGIVVLACSMLFFACDNTKPKITWSEKSVSLEISEELSLDSLLNIENAKVTDVQYCSLNEDVVLIRGRKAVAVGAGNAFVQATVQNQNTYLTINVSAPKEQFEKISNLAFDSMTGKLSWNRAVKMIDGQNVYADSYEISITKDNQTERIESTENFVIFEDNGEYSVRVTAKKDGFLNSDTSDALAFKILSTPTNIQFDKVTSTLSWQSDYTKFAVQVDDLVLTANEKSIKLNLEQVKSYSLKVSAVDGEFLSKPSQTLVITRLAVPTINAVENGVISFERTQQALATGYKISVRSALDEQPIEIDNTTGEYTLENKTHGEYYIQVKAVGNEYAFDSAYSDFVKVEKLKTPTLTFDKTTKTITSDLQNVTIFVKNLITNQTTQTNIEGFTHQFEQNVGIYEIYAQNRTKVLNQIQSDLSASIFVKKLGAVQNLTHQTENNKSIILFDGVMDGYSYDIYVDNVLTNGTFEKTSTGAKFSLEQNTDAIFASGTKNIKIVSHDYDFDSRPNYFVLSEDATSAEITVERFEKLNPTYNSQIDWENIQNAICYQYELYKDGQLYLQGKESTNNFAVTNLEFGNYTFKVKAIGNNSTYLSSLEFGQVEFSIKEQLQSPNVIFDKTNKTLVITPVKNADRYIVFYEGAQIGSFDNQNLVCDISSFLSGVKTYEFQVWAESSTNDALSGGNLYKSENTTITIEKLKAIENIFVSKEQQIQIDLQEYQNKISACKTYIDDQLVENLNTYAFLVSNTLKVQLVANNNTNPYYLDSDEAIFTLEKLATVQNVVFNDYVLSWDVTENAKSYIVYISKDNEKFDMEIMSNEIDLNQNPIYKQMVDAMGDGWSVSIVAKAGDQTVGVGTKGYLKSEPSNLFTIHKLQTPTLTNFVSQDDDDLTVKIDFSDVENALSYEIYVDGVQQTTDISEISVSDLQQVKTYTITIIAKNPQYISSDRLVVTLQRLAKIENINIDTKQENFDVQYALETSNGVKADGTVTTLPYDLSAISTTQTTLQLQLSGKIDLENQKMYLASEKTSFTILRHGIVTNFAFDGDILSWDIVDKCDYYNIIIENAQSQTLSLIVPAKNANGYVNTLDLSKNLQIQEFIEQSGIYNAKINACVNNFTLGCQEDDIGYLCGEYSNLVELQKLETPTNLQVSCTDAIMQTQVTISWDSVTDAEKYFVYINDILLGETDQTQIQTDKLLYSSEFSSKGNFKIHVVAKATGKIASNKSDIYQLYRLPKIEQNSLKVSKTGVFSWATIQNSTNFASFIEFNNISTGVAVQDTQSKDYAEKIYETTYSGQIKFYVCAVGDGATYLSGEYQLLQVTKLDMPKLNILGNSINIEPSDLNPSAMFDVKVSFKTSEENIIVLATFSLNSNTSSTNNSYVFPKEWDAYDNGEFVFEVVATSDDCINSNALEKTASRVQGGTFKGFARKATDSDKIDLVVEVGQKIENASYYLVLKSAQQLVITNVVPNEQNLLVYAIENELSFAIGAQNFEFEFYVSAPNKLNSVTSKIAGKRLNQITNFAPKKGQMSWNASIDSECLGYILKVSDDDGINLHKLSKDVLSSELFGYSGQIVLNIKALGNITDEYKTEDIILDSNYITKSVQDQVQEDNLTVYKNPIPTDTKVYLGQFKLATNQNIYSWKAKVNDTEYTLTGQITEDDFFVGFSEDMYFGNNKLIENTLYSIQFKACGNDAQNILNSDYSSAISIKIHENPIQNSQDIQFMHSKEKIDFYDISWKSNPLATKYVLQITTQQAILPLEMSQIVTSQTMYSLGCNYYPSGTYQVSVGVLGSETLEQGDFYYLSSKMSNTKGFTKLSKATVRVEDGKLSWTSVENASAYYVYYMKKTSDDEVTYEQFIQNYTMFDTAFTKTEWQLPDNFGDNQALSNYYFGVRAVSSDYTLYAPSQIGPFATAEKEKTVMNTVTKLKTPDSISLVSGTLKWIGTYNVDSELNITEGISPFVYDTNHKLSDYIVSLRFEDSNKKFTTCMVSASILFDIAQVDVMEKYGLSEPLGVPSLAFVTDMLGVKPGEYSLSIMQRGDDINWINSNYTAGKNVYVPHAPKIRLSNFVLSWDEVNLIESKPLGNSKKYTVVAEDKTYRRIIYQTNDLAVDLRDLVNSDKLLAGEYKIFVYVNGDSSYYINGLISNKLDIKVLPEAVATMEGGILTWNSVSQTVKYNITSDCGNTNYYYEFETSDNRWDMSELLCFDNLNNRLSYNIQVRCIGDGTTTISGKVANVGNVIKLLTPQLQVKHGAFVWENIEGNEGYTLTIQNQDTQIINIGKDKTNYETKTAGYNLYNIRAVGTTSSNLDETSTSYAISSYMTQGIYGIMLEKVSGLSIKSGRLMWLAQKDFNNNDVRGFKLSFGDINFYEPIYIEDYAIEYIDGDKYIAFQIDEKFIPGDYQVYVQAYSDSNYVYEQNTYSQLLGAIDVSTTLNFAKLRQVSNLRAQNGVATWDSNDEKSNHYLLTFTKDGQKYEFECQGTTWDPTKLSDEDAAIYAKLLVGTNYKLKVKVLGNDSDLINSDYCEEQVFTKIDTIKSIEYLEEQDESFVIRWYFDGQVAGITDYHYALKYDNGSGQNTIYSNISLQIRRGYDSVKKMFYGEVNGSQLLVSSSTSLKYQVSVIPVSQTNILASDYSQERTVFPPQGIASEFAFNSQKRSISWTYTTSGSDVKFRILDELVTLDKDNNITVQSSKIYISQSTEYVIESIGLHRISVCVVLTGESVASPYVHFDYPVAVEGLVKDNNFATDLGTFTIINFDLFQSGDGSTANPYLITNQSQFENINQRLTRPSYLGSEQWKFVLGQDLTFENVVSINDFGGIFDGQNYTITYSISNTTEKRIGLFKKLLANGKIQNLCIRASLHQQNYTSVTELFISPFVIENQGIIQDCRLLEFNYTSALSNLITINFGGFCVNNSATIKNCISSADITFDGNIQQQGILRSNINVGGIVHANVTSTKALIENCGNDGNITVRALTISVGGIAVSHNLGKISGCYFKGSLDVFISQSGSNINRIGGLAALSKQKIENSYTNCNITVDMNNLSRTVYVGGFVGEIADANGAIINNCFVAKSDITIQNDSLLKCTVGILVGYSNAQGTQSQSCSYYAQSSTLQPIVNAPSGFDCEVFTSYADLLDKLSGNDYAFKANGDGVPKLLWEA